LSLISFVAVSKLVDPSGIDLNPSSEK